MSLITRCPACATMFKVVPDQLRISDGWVRCGQCAEIFDATQQLIASANTPAEPPAAADPEPAPSLSPPQPVPAAPAPLPADEEGVAPPDTVANTWMAADDVQETPAPTAAWHDNPARVPLATGQDNDGPQAGVAQNADAAADAPATASIAQASAETAMGAAEKADDAVAAPAQPPTASTDPSDVLPGLDVPVDAPDAPDVPVTPPASHTAEASPPPPDPHQPALTRASFDPITLPAGPIEVPPVAPQAPDSPVPSFMRQHPPAGTSVWQRPVWRTALRVAAPLLCVALALQMVRHERDRIVALAPDTRPALERFCQWTECALSPLRRIESIVIDGSSFGRVRDNLYRLGIGIRNTANLPVLLPAVELALTNPQAQTLVRRVIDASEFGTAPVSLQPGAEWNGTLLLRIDPTPAVQDIAGYGLFAFYP